MRNSINLFLIFIFTTLSLGCEKKVETIPVTLKLTPDNVKGKSGQTIEATLYINALNGAKNIVIYKTVNLVKDSKYGNVTVTPQLVSGNDYVYKFSYQLSPDEVDKLVGFNFHVVDNNGAFAEKDLTVNTITSGWQTIYSRKWKLVSRMWTTITPPAEDLKDCEKDDIYTFNREGTYSINFGKAACSFDGFNVYDTWVLSEDEKTFTTKYHSLFDPANITTEIYTVKSISSEKLVMQQTLDLSIFGLTDKEVFVYTFEAAP